VLAEEAQTIIDAQRARGLELEKGNFFRKVRNYIPILIPLIVSAIRRSLEMAEAMEARAWGATKRRTNLYVLELRRGDYIFMAVTIGILVIAVLIRLYTYVPRLEELLAKMF
jgi:energy-coupling factor transport system permease protein